MSEPAAVPEPELPLEPTPTPEPGAWREGLSEGLRSNPVLERFPNLDALAKEHVNLQKHIGTEKTSLPQSGWKDEDYAQLYNALGRPETPEGYDLAEFKPPEGVPWDEGFQTRMVAHLHQAGLSQRQVSQVLDSYSEEIGGQWQEASRAVEDQKTETEGELRKEWGKAYPERVDLAKRAFRELAGESFEELAGVRLESGGLLGSHPSIIRIFSRLGEEMSEAGLVAQKGGPVGFTPEQASAERARLQADESFLKALLDSNHPEHALAVKRMDDLTTAELGDQAEVLVP